jgi:hypothetical protein
MGMDQSNIIYPKSSRDFGKRSSSHYTIFFIQRKRSLIGQKG